MAKTIADQIYLGMCSKDLYKSNKGTSRAAIKNFLLDKGFAKDAPGLNSQVRRSIGKLLDDGLIIVGVNAQRFLVNQDKKAEALKKFKPKKKAAPKKKTTKKKSKSVKPKKKAASKKKAVKKTKSKTTKKKSAKPKSKKAAKPKSKKTTKKAKKKSTKKAKK